MCVVCVLSSITVINKYYSHSVIQPFQGSQNSIIFGTVIYYFREIILELHFFKWTITILEINRIYRTVASSNVHYYSGNQLFVKRPPQCPTMKLNKRSLPKPTTTTGWKLIPHSTVVGFCTDPAPLIIYNFFRFRVLWS